MSNEAQGDKGAHETDLKQGQEGSGARRAALLAGLRAANRAGRGEEILQAFAAQRTGGGAGVVESVHAALAERTPAGRQPSTRREVEEKVADLSQQLPAKVSDDVRAQLESHEPPGKVTDRRRRNAINRDFEEVKKGTGSE